MVECAGECGWAASNWLTVNHPARMFIVQTIWMFAQHLQNGERDTMRMVNGQ